MSKFNVLIVQPKGFEHVEVFRDLADTICASLVDLGHESKVTVRHAQKNARLILLNFHSMADFKRVVDVLPSDTIIVNTEHLWDRRALNNRFEVNAVDWETTSRVIFWSQRFETWNIGPENLSLLFAAGARNLKSLKLGYHPNLDRIPLSQDRPIDILFYGSMSNRRQSLLSSLERAGLKINHLFGIYGAQRDQKISEAKVVLNCSYYPDHIFEAVRVSYPVTNGVLTLSEDHALVDLHFRESCAFARYPDLLDEALRIVREKDWKWRGFAYQQNFKKYRRADFTKEILEY